MTTSQNSRGLFITGGSGFIGRQLLVRLGETSFQPVYNLTRKTENGRADRQNRNHIRTVTADLLDVQAYAECLKGCDTVLHMAAATGKAGRDEHFRVNSRGTQALVEASKKAGVRKFLYVSTIAVMYPDKSRYYYAQSKEQGEQIVKNSGLDYTIIRPTIVIGQGSAIWKSLSGLARGSAILMFGDGKTEIQPIYLEDLVDCLLDILREIDVQEEVVELGGPEQTNFDEFVEQIHTAGSNSRARILHLPLKPIKAILSALENIAYGVLPVTVGQLSAFSNNGTIQASNIHNRKAATMKGVKEMVELVMIQDSRAATEKQLMHECGLLTRYLVGQQPSDYVIEKFVEAHKFSSIFDESKLKPFERFLLRNATRNIFTLKVIDAYSAFFSRSSILRNKLILMVAILESCTPSYRSFDPHPTAPVIQILLNLFANGLGFAVAFALAILILIPIQILFALRARLSGEGGKS
jgi:NADH dehydrogenase